MNEEFGSLSYQGMAFLLRNPPVLSGGELTRPYRSLGSSHCQSELESVAG